MRFAIYGAGIRGKKLLEHIGADQIIVYIDSNREKQGKEYCGKQVISLEDYIEQYTHYFIIISPTDSAEIEYELKRRGIYQFSTVRSMPSEYCGYGDGSIDECYGELKKNVQNNYIIYGLNAFALILYEYFISDHTIYIVPERNMVQMVDWITKEYPEILLKGQNEIEQDKTVLITTGSFYQQDFAAQIKNEMIDMLEYSNNAECYYNKELAQFKNIYKNKKRCFIVATGPSLQQKDLNILKTHQEFCISMNGIFMGGCDWNADVYVGVDASYIDENIRNIDQYPSELKFISDGCKEFWKKTHNNTYKFHSVINQYSNRSVFSEDICQKVYEGYTVTSACIQFAVYFGFKEIYLLGVDCNYIKGSKNNHFVPEEKPDNANNFTDGMVISYQMAEEYAKEHGIKIYNATRGGKLEVFKRIDFDSLFDEAVE